MEHRISLSSTATTVAALTCLWASAAAAQAPDALELLQQMRQRHSLQHETETVELELIKKSGRSKTRMLERYASRTPDGLDRLLAVITEPEDLRGTGVLLVERADHGVDQWLYLPALNRVKQVDGKDRDNKFMGTDFCYGDLQAEDLAAHHYSLRDVEELEGRSCHLIEALPASPTEAKESGYSKRLVWVDEEILFVRRVEYYNLKGELLKTLENKALEEVAAGAWRSNEMVMTTVKKNHRSIMRVRHRRLDEAPDEALFSVESLRSFGK